MDYRKIIIPLLLVILVYLIQTEGDCLVTLGVAIMLIFILNNYIRHESFVVSDLTNIQNPSLLYLEQEKINSNIKNLEDNLRFIKLSLQEKVDEQNVNSIQKIKILNSCVKPSSTNEQVTPGLISNNLPINSANAGDL